MNKSLKIKNKCGQFEIIDEILCEKKKESTFKKYILTMKFGQVDPWKTTDTMDMTWVKIGDNWQNGLNVG